MKIEDNIGWCRNLQSLCVCPEERFMTTKQTPLLWIMFALFASFNVQD